VSECRIGTFEEFDKLPEYRQNPAVFPHAPRHSNFAQESCRHADRRRSGKIAGGLGYAPEVSLKQTPRMTAAVEFVEHYGQSEFHGHIEPRRMRPPDIDFNSRQIVEKVLAGANQSDNP
jgi:hypothetical protein